MSDSDFMGFDEAMCMVLNSYDTIEKMIEAHNRTPVGESTNKLLLECAMLSVIWHRLGKPGEIAYEMIRKWERVCELNSVPQVD